MKPSVAKQKGAATETMYVTHLISKYNLFNVERRHLSGANDKGDIAGWASSPNKKVCVEVKSGAQLSLPKWLAELKEEKKNSGANVGCVVVRPKGKPAPDDWFVIMPHPEFMELMREAGYLYD